MGTWVRGRSLRDLVAEQRRDLAQQATELGGGGLLAPHQAELVLDQGVVHDDDVVRGLGHRPPFLLQATIETRAGERPQAAHPLAGHRGQCRDHRADTRHIQVGPDLGQRLEHEPALRHPGMGNGEPGYCDRPVAVHQDVQVDDPRPPAHPSLPAHPPLDVEQALQHVGWWEVGLGHHHRVEIVTLAGPAHRRRLVYRGHRTDRPHGLGDGGRGRGEMGCPIAEVRPEPDGDGDRHPGIGISRRPSGPSGLPVISWMTEVATTGSLTRPQ